MKPSLQSMPNQADQPAISGWRDVTLADRNAIFAQFPHAMVWCNADFQMQAMNPSFTRLVGVEEGLLVGRSLGEFLVTTNRATTESVLLIAQAVGGYVGSAWVRTVGKSPAKAIDLSIAQIKQDGAARGYIAQLIDVSARWASDTDLRESLQRLEMALWAANDGVWDWNIETGQTYYSTRFKWILGFADDDFEPHIRSVFSRIHPQDRRRVVRITMAASAQSECDYRLRRKDGQYCWVQSRWASLVDAQGVRYRMVGSLTDLTERKRAEDLIHLQQTELAHAQRVSAMGELAAGLAHEINQPLTSVVNFTRGCIIRLQSGVMPTEELVEKLQHAHEEGRRAALIVQQLREFIRKGEPTGQVVDLQPLVERAISFVVRDISRAEIRLVCQFEAPPTLVQADPIQITQVLYNLLRNSIEAMQGVPRERHRLIVEVESTPTHARISIGDTGAGADAVEQILRAMNQPFVTTKPNGLGLGLSISRSIIEAHRGQLTVTPETPRGIVMHIHLPRLT